MTNQTPSPQRKPGFLAGIRTFLSAMRTPHMPSEEIATRILAHLAEKGRTRTYDLYMLFKEENDAILSASETGVPAPDDPAYVSIASVFHVMQALERQDHVTGESVEFEGRVQTFWSVNPWGGTRRRAKARSGERQAGTGMAPVAVTRDSLH